MLISLLSEVLLSRSGDLSSFFAGSLSARASLPRSFTVYSLKTIQSSSLLSLSDLLHFLRDLQIRSTRFHKRRSVNRNSSPLFKGRIAFLLRRARCEAPYSLRGCDPPCLSMRNNAPVEHCAAEAFILHREIVLTMKASFTLRAYLTTAVASIAR